MLSFFKSDKESYLKELMSAKPDKDKLKSYLKKGIDINEKDEKGRNVLFTLATNKKYEAIKILIELGIDIYQEDSLGKTILAEASEKYDFMTVRFLLDNGFDINRQNRLGRTILQDSVLLGNDKVFQILINYEPNFDLKDKDGKTVLFDAVENGNLETLQKVLELISNINEVDNLGQTVLFKAVLKDDLKIALALISKGISVNKLDNYGQNVLFNTVLQGNKNNIVLKHLIKRGIDLNVIDDRDRTIIDEIFYIRTLQKYDKDLDDIRYSMINPEDDYLYLALLIIEAGFKIDSEDKHGKTALQKEIERRNFSNAEFLINCGANVNVIDENGRNLVHKEILKGYKNDRVIDFLISKGANLNQKDRFSKTIIDNLIELILVEKGEKLVEDNLANFVQEDGGFDILLKKVLSYDANVNYTDTNGQNLVFDLVKYDSFDILDILVEYGINLNCVDNSGKTPLMYLVEDGLKIEDRTLKAYFVKRLQNFLKYRVSLDFQDKDGKTVIHKAVIADDTLVVEKLMFKKSNINIKDNHGRTALHHTQWKGNYQIARWLISAGADMNAIDNSGFNILNYAAILGHTKLVITLISSGVLMYNNAPKNKKVAHFFKTKEKMLDKLLEFDEVSDEKMKQALVEVVANFKKEIDEALINGN